jgi:hypothetical protein
MGWNKLLLYYDNVIITLFTLIQNFYCKTGIKPTEQCMALQITWNGKSFEV